MTVSPLAPSQAPILDHSFIGQEPADREPSLRKTVMAGLIAVGVGFGGFFGWAFLADLDSAAIAPGTVIVDSRRKTISHLEGGILKELLVRDGDRVAAGQPLLRLDDTQIQAVLSQLSSQYWSAAFRAERMRAEQAGDTVFTPPALLAAAAAQDPVAADALAAEQRLLTTRGETHAGTLAMQRRRIEQLHQQVKALKAQATATTDRLAYTEDELKSVSALLAKGYERKPRQLELQRLTAELRGALGEIQAREAEVSQAIAGAELEVLNIESTRQTEISEELQRSQTLAADFAERLRSARDILARQVVTAPQAGRVVGLQFVTPGSAVPPGAPILDLVPEDDELVVEAMLAPADIDSVAPGREAFVRLTAYKQRSVPPVRAEVVTVSPDLLTDPRTGQPYYLTRVRLDPAVLEAIADIHLYPGMPAEVLITGTRRKAIDYFLAPLTDSMRRALREE